MMNSERSSFSGARISRRGRRKLGYSTWISYSEPGLNQSVRRLQSTQAGLETLFLLPPIEEAPAPRTEHDSRTHDVEMTVGSGETALRYSDVFMGASRPGSPRSLHGEISESAVCPAFAPQSEPSKISSKLPNVDLFAVHEANNSLRPLMSEGEQQAVRYHLGTNPFTAKEYQQAMSIMLEIWERKQAIRPPNTGNLPFYHPAEFPWPLSPKGRAWSTIPSLFNQSSKHRSTGTRKRWRTTLSGEVSSAR